MPVISRKKSKKLRPAVVNEERNPREKDKKQSNLPGTHSYFKAFLSARLCSAIWSHISDCDEVYNYWEPSHYLLFGKGFQTWEYSPEYALRSYTYLLLHVVPAWIYSSFLQPNRMLIFYFIRCLLALFCSLCEFYFFRSVSKNFNKISLPLLAFLIFSPGMFISSSAYLPSSFSMYLCLLSMGAWFNEKYELAIFCTALSTFLSWPFAGLLGVPIAIDLLFRKKQIFKFIQWSAISTIVILFPMVKIDSDMFGKLVIAPLNIVLYNVFSSHGPNIYGTEPFHFYFLNGFLNFNFIFVIAVLTPLIMAITHYLLSPSEQEQDYCPDLLYLSPLYLWLLVFSLQPHKEERFLFPVYPLICFNGAVGFSLIQMLLKKFTWNYSSYVALLLPPALATVLLGLSRIFAVYHGYHAPMDVFMELNKIYNQDKIPTNMNVNVCIGKEWYRFTSSFFLPDDRWNLRFIESEFRGQLPAPYSPHDNGTSIIHHHFNDRNLEERSRYFDIDKCHFLIDSELGNVSPLEPRYSEQTDKWSIVEQFQFLDSANSHRFFRAFYIPFLSSKYCKFGFYNLLRAVKFKFG